jgi:hypothetical protein
MLDYRMAKRQNLLFTSKKTPKHRRKQGERTLEAISKTVFVLQ